MLGCVTAETPAGGVSALTLTTLDRKLFLASLNGVSRHTHTHTRTHTHTALERSSAAQ